MTIFSLLLTAINFPWNKYNISDHFLKTLLHYHVKQKFKNVAVALPFFDDKAVNSTIKKYFKNLK